MRSRCSSLFGAEKPLLREYTDATWFHGRDGLGDHNYPPPRRAPEKLQGVDAIIETIEANPGLVLVTLGPLTNVALALSRKPSIAAQVSRCVIMGGNPCCEGNVTPAAEYNMWVDPEAARIVMLSGLAVDLIGWHLCRGESVLGPSDIAHVEGFNTELAHFAIECNSHAREALKTQTGEDGICLPDPVAMCLALDASVGTEWSEHYIEVETQSELTRGMTVVDRFNVSDDERNRVVWSQALQTRRKAKVCWTITRGAGKMRFIRPSADGSRATLAINQRSASRLSGARTLLAPHGREIYFLRRRPGRGTERHRACP
jgi:purine nucleosidase